MYTEKVEKYIPQELAEEEQGTKPWSTSYQNLIQSYS